MFRPALSHPNGFDASGSSDLTLLPPTTLTEAFRSSAYRRVVPDPAGTTANGSTEDHLWFEDWWMVASLCDE
jgi:hypothetical protein